MALSVVTIVFGALTLALGVGAISIWQPVMLILGLAVFAVAMAFDMSDPQRRTLKADNAFWLHLVAAPLIVYAAIALLTENGRTSFTTTDAVIVVAVFLVLGLIAVVIDRRALLVAGISYFGFAVATLMHEANMTTAGVLAATLVFVGAFVVGIGAGWRPMRRAVIGSLPRQGLLVHLPPASRIRAS